MTSKTAEKPVITCSAIAEAGITNSQQTLAFLSALIADASAGRITTALVHSTCNAVGKMLRVVEMETRFGTPGRSEGLSFVQPRKVNNGGAQARQRALAKLSKEDLTALGLTG